MYKTHEMRKIRTEEASGREEWACPTCGRRMLLRWPPHYEKQVVEPGDERACHVGSSADAPAPPRETGDRQWRDAHRWLRETGVDTAHAPVVDPPAPSRLGPIEPV